MNIAFVHYSFPGIGGTETVTRLLADYFVSLGHRVYVIAWHKGDNGKVPTSVTQVLTLPDQQNINSEANCEAIVGFVKDGAIDVLINQGPFWAVEQRVKDCGCKVVSVLHYSPSFRIDNNRNAIKKCWSNQTGSPVYLAKTAIRRAFINRFAWTDFKHSDREKLRAIVRDSDAFVVLCDKYVSQLKDILGLESDNIIAINNPVPDVKVVTEPLDNRKGLVFVGRLTKWDKRVDRLLYIWKLIQSKHPDWTLYIVGDGEEKANLMALAKRLGLRRLEFTGFTDPKLYLQRSSILCLTSSSEGFPMVILEAQQFGLIPVAFNASAGIEQVIGDSGYLVKPFDLKAYAQTLSTLMADVNIDSHRARSYDNIKKYNIDNIGKNWISLFKNIYDKPL